MIRQARWILPLTCIVVTYCMLGFYRTTNAAPPPPPFANSVEQRLETVQQLKEIKALLKEQNALLQSGNVKVIIVEQDKAGGPVKVE
jgi:hypothetical protein